MTVERMCQLGGISRSGFYRMGSRSEGVDRDVPLVVIVAVQVGTNDDNRIKPDRITDRSLFIDSAGGET